MKIIERDHAPAYKSHGQRAMVFEPQDGRDHDRQNQHHAHNALISIGIERLGFRRWHKFRRRRLGLVMLRQRSSQSLDSAESATRMNCMNPAAMPSKRPTM